MADVKIRKLPDWVLTHFQSLARQAGHSTEEELRDLLTETVLRAQWEFADEADRIRQELFEKHGVFSESAEIIREGCDQRR